MYSSEDLERFYFQYQTEAMPKGISIEQFCSCNKVPYNIFYKWYKESANRMQSSLLKLLRCSLSYLKKVQTECNQTCLNC